jgi:hypothetical protein
MRGERKPVQFDRLQRFYEDEMLSRRPIKFNSFDPYIDEITRPHKLPQRSYRNNPKYYDLARYNSFDDSFVESSPSPPPLLKIKPTKPKFRSYEVLVPTTKHHYIEPPPPASPLYYEYDFGEEHAEYDNESSNSNEDDNEANISNDSENDFEQEVIAIHRIRKQQQQQQQHQKQQQPQPPSSVINYEYRSSSTPVLNLPPIVHTPTVISLPPPPPPPQPQPIISIRPLMPAKQTIIRTTTPQSIVSVSSTPVLTRRRSVRFRQSPIFSESHQTKTTTYTKVDLPKKLTLFRNKHSQRPQPQVQSKPLKSILRNKIFTPDAAFSLNY